MADEVDNVDTENVNLEEEKSGKLLQLPLSRIKHLVKMDPDVHMANQDAVFLIARATELFIESLSREAYTFTARAKKKTIQKKDVEAAVGASDCLVFLEGALD